MTHESETTLSGTHPESQMLNEKRETLAEELKRLVGEYQDDDAGDATKAEAWNMIADFAVENAATVVSALSAIHSQEAAAPSDEPVAWRWRPKGATLWLYDPEPEWIVDQDRDDIDLEPLFASPAVAPVAVSVKGLEWTGPNLSMWVSVPLPGFEYRIMYDGRGHDAFSWFCGGTWTPAASLEAAKAAAQADYEARILSALVRP